MKDQTTIAVMITIRVVITVMIYLVLSSKVAMLGISRAHSSKIKQKIRNINHIRRMFILLSFYFDFWALVESCESSLREAW